MRELASCEPELKRFRVPSAFVKEPSIRSAPWLFPVGFPQ